MTREKALERWGFAGFEEGGRVAKECGWLLEASKGKEKDGPLKPSERYAVLPTP